MPDYDDAVASASELAEQVRALAYATRDLADRPGDFYWMLGSLLQANRRLVQVYSQVANAHIAAEELARTDGGDATMGRRHAHDAAAALRRAVRLVEQIDGELDAASQSSGRIAWSDAPAVVADGGVALDVEALTLSPDGRGIGV
ncbi:hypothetical protein [Oerskovia paurometabola]|uniref:hypothetical protein n=1 Tax=Oerskovia paurometabola TaxID=162170 RepID=UPI003413A509